jgi:hypothetical protein
MMSTVKRFQVSIFVEITAAPRAIRATGRIEVNIAPAETPQQTKIVKYNFNLNRLPITINLSEPIIATANQFLEDILDVYIDEERDLKTLLNYGEDKQSVALAYRRGPFDLNGIETIQLKLLQPVPDDITTNTPVFLSREVAKTVIDKVRVRFTPELDTTPYLRPKNLKAKTNVDTGRILKNVTLSKLQLQSGSVGLVDQLQNKNFEDEIFRQWYSYDFNSSELNIDFTNYSNFIFYSSAAMRLAAFKEKLKQIEFLEGKREQVLATYTANTGSAGIIFLKEKSEDYSLQKENIIRSFDRYEQYLFFTPTGSTSAYSASFEYVDGGTEYNAIGYWPKSGSNLYPVASDTATEWFENQYAIAQRFDEFNENNLVNTIPTYLREDHESSSYLTFVTMIAQMFDNIKLYVDQYPYIYSRNIDPNTEISKDLINEIAESFGFTVPSIDSVYDLTDTVLGTENTTSRRELTAEIYKRLLHNLPFFKKAKGTKTALNTFVKTFGITPQFLTVRETGTPTEDSYQVFEEYSNGVYFNKNKISYIKVPVSASLRTPAPVGFQFSVLPKSASPMTLLTGDEKWGLSIIPHPTNLSLGQFVIRSGSSNTAIITSSYQEIYNNKLLNIAFKNNFNTASFYFAQVDDDDITFNQKVIETTNFSSLWSTTAHVYVGGSGSRVTSPCDAVIDEFRLWGTALTDSTLLDTAFDPSSNAGDKYTDAVDYLYIQLSFNTIDSASLASNLLINESPYKNIGNSPPLIAIETYNIVESDFVRYNRIIKQRNMLAGVNAPVTNKIVVADDPVFLNEREGARLYRTKSIMSPETKKFGRANNKVILAVSPTDIINQNIIRNFGLENINAIIGAPTTVYPLFEKTLNTLKRYYEQYYFVDVNSNKFIRIVSDISSAINQVVEYFIPSRAKLLKGVIIEPNILEQTKILIPKKIRFYGKDTRKTLDAANSLTSSAPDYGATFNVSDNVDIHTGLVSASYPTFTTQLQDPDSIDIYSRFDDYNSTLNVNDNTTLLGNYNQYTSGVEVEDLLQVLSYINQYTSSVEVDDIMGAAAFVNQYTSSVDYEYYKIVSSSYITIASNSLVDVGDDNVIASLGTQYVTYGVQHQPINYSGSEVPVSIDAEITKLNKINYNDVNLGSPGAEPYNRLYSRKLFEHEIRTPRYGGLTSIYTPALYEIPPSADFRDLGVYTYFNNDDGIYFFNEIKKMPVYVDQLNAVWDFEKQTFGDTITSWSYGAKYNKSDVVYQDISNEYLRTFYPSESLKVVGGNKRYYVFKNRPVYAEPTTGESYYSGSVPSYIPPSLDNVNWDLLRFRPIQVRSPRRVVYDTFTVASPILNNFKVTTIDIKKNINTPSRFVDEVQLDGVLPNSQVSGEIVVQNMALIFALQATVAKIRIRFYRTSIARDNDAARSINTQPVGAHGVLFDGILDSATVLQLTNPIPTFVADAVPPAGTLFYMIDNLENVTKSGIKLLMYYFASEIEPRLPRGYLQKHYKFFRDNSTATKRRNYLGCKNTIDTTVDGKSPIEVFISEGTDIVVARPTGNEEIVTGGGGQLNVT